MQGSHVILMFVGALVTAILGAITAYDMHPVVADTNSASHALPLDLIDRVASLQSAVIVLTVRLVLGHMYIITSLLTLCMSDSIIIMTCLKLANFLVYCHMLAVWRIYGNFVYSFNLSLYCCMDTCKLHCSRYYTVLKSHNANNVNLFMFAHV